MLAIIWYHIHLHACLEISKVSTSSFHPQLTTNCKILVSHLRLSLNVKPQISLQKQRYVFHYRWVEPRVSHTSATTHTHMDAHTHTHKCTYTMHTCMNTHTHMRFGDTSSALLHKRQPVARHLDSAHKHLIIPQHTSSVCNICTVQKSIPLS